METQNWKIEWNDSMSVGIPEIDEDERRFLSLVDKLNDAIACRMDITEIRLRLQTIVDDSERHYPAEERLLRGRRYPNVGEHALIHAQIKNLIRKIASESAIYGCDVEWIAAGLRIKEILIDHVLIEDKKYADYYRATRGFG